MAARLRVLAIAVASGRMGYVFFSGDRLCDWGIARQASKSPKLAEAQARVWIKRLRPDVVVTEKIDNGSRKGDRTKRVIKAVTKAASAPHILDVVVPRIRSFKNKYDEAMALVDRFPELDTWVPRRRRIWEAEPRTTIYFEALALALVVIDGDQGQAPTI
ncbi:hypothetical protein [Hyphomonas sp.]|uniref:hypothetical protein n=1 Tax=Alphaproteobacteria TaxID=28211 RepID=UPI003263AE15